MDSNNNTSLEFYQAGSSSPRAIAQFVFTPVYFILVLLSLLSNGFIIIGVVKRLWAQGSKSNSVHVFILNQSVSDLMMVLICIPLTWLGLFVDSWPFGDLMCKMLPLVLMSSVMLSILSGVGIAIQRYLVIVHSRYSRIAELVLFIVLSWAISVGLSLPMAMFKHTSAVELGDRSVVICNETWPSDQARRSFPFILLIVQYIAPTIILIFCYWQISYKMTAFARKWGRKKRSNSKHLLEWNRFQDRRRKNRILILMVVTFMVAWLPFNIFSMIPSQPMDEKTLFLFFTTHAIAMSSAIYNGFLYGWMNGELRKEITKLLPCVRREPNESIDRFATLRNRTSPTSNSTLMHHQVSQLPKDNQLVIIGANERALLSPRATARTQLELSGTSYHDDSITTVHPTTTDTTTVVVVTSAAVANSPTMIRLNGKGNTISLDDNLLAETAL